MFLQLRSYSDTLANRGQIKVKLDANNSVHGIYCVSMPNLFVFSGGVNAKIRLLVAHETDHHF